MPDTGKRRLIFTGPLCRAMEGGALRLLFTLYNTTNRNIFRKTVLLGLVTVPFPLLALGAGFFEEHLFRGLIYRSLSRSWPTLPSILASAALFAAVHPPAAMLPVFGLGVLAALAFERTGLLLAPILVHALYNADVLGAQLL